MHRQLLEDFTRKNHQNFITGSVVSEIKDLKSKLILDSAIKEGSIKIMEPDSIDIKDVSDVINESGDVLRLSDVDKNLVALAFKLKRESMDPNGCYR